MSEGPILVGWIAHTTSRTPTFIARKTKPHINGYDFKPVWLLPEQMQPALGNEPEEPTE